MGFRVLPKRSALVHVVLFPSMPNTTPQPTRSSVAPFDTDGSSNTSVTRRTVSPSFALGFRVRILKFCGRPSPAPEFQLPRYQSCNTEMSSGPIRSSPVISWMSHAEGTQPL